MRLFLIGWFGAGNAGDEAILLSELLTIRNRIEGVKFHILSFNTGRTEKLTAGIPEVEKIIGMGAKKSFFKSDFKGLLSAFKKVDMVIIGGGGIFQDIYNYYPIPFFTIMALAARFFRKQLMLYSVGIGPVITYTGKKLCRIAAGSAHIISVRDRESRDLLAAFGVKKEIHVSADPVFLLGPVRNEKVEEIIRTKNIPGNGPAIGVCVQDLLFWSSPNKKKLADVLDMLAAEKNAGIVFIPMGAYHDGWLRKEKSDAVDVSASKEIAGMMKNDYPVLTEHLDPRELMSVIGSLDLIISMRLHGLIMGIVTGVPVIALTFSEESKIKNLMKGIGHEEELFYVNTLDPEKLMKKAVDILTKKEEPKKEMKEKASILSREAEKSIELLSKAV